MKKTTKLILFLAAVSVIVSSYQKFTGTDEISSRVKEETKSITEVVSDESVSGIIEEVLEPTPSQSSDIKKEEQVSSVSITDIPVYNGVPWVEYNNNVPFFSEADLTSEPFEYYSALDILKRPQTAFANICEEIMPTEERGEIGQIKPAGWYTVKYDCIEDLYLYNRCHLIAYCLAGENDNELNLITGTRYMNTEGMLSTEVEVAQYVESTHNHVLYRVTPIYEGDNLIASGVLMEAYSVEDNGGLSFCRYAFNVQPQIIIDYRTGDSRLDETAVSESPAVEERVAVEDNNSVETNISAETGDVYILNTNSLKIHKPTCESVEKMSEKNKQEYTGSLEELYSKGYADCQNCLK